jgi:nuclear pore complex protein Nup205
MYIAGLLHYVMTRNPHIDSVTCAEAIIVEFHKRRRNLVDCLYLILTEAAKADLPNLAKVHVRLEKFVTRELLPGYEVPGGRVHLAQDAFRQIDALDATISKVQTDRQNAGSNTIAPSAQGELRLHFASRHPSSYHGTQRVLRVWGKIS